MIPHALASSGTLLEGEGALPENASNETGAILLEAAEIGSGEETPLREAATEADTSAAVSSTPTPSQASSASTEQRVRFRRYTNDEEGSDGSGENAQTISNEHGVPAESSGTITGRDAARAEREQRKATGSGAAVQEETASGITVIRTSSGGATSGTGITVNGDVREETGALLTQSGTALTGSGTETGTGTVADTESGTAVETEEKIAEEETLRILEGLTGSRVGRVTDTPLNFQPTFTVPRHREVLELDELEQRIVLSATDGNGNPLEIKYAITDAQGNFIITIIPPRTFTPGMYRVQGILQAAQGANRRLQRAYRLTNTEERDITLFDEEVPLGMIAFNTDTSNAAAGDTSDLSFSFMDKEGQPVCNANVSLSVQQPSGQQTIPVERETYCGARKFTEKPDYVVRVPFPGAGEHTITMKREGEVFEHTMRIGSAQPPVRIERASVTRTFPGAKENMRITITPQETFVGTVEEYIPNGFEAGNIEPIGSITRNWQDRSTTITWDRRWEAGETVTLQYTVETSEAVPQFAVFGPLQFRGNTEKAAETEPIVIQIAPAEGSAEEQTETTQTGTVLTATGATAAVETAQETMTGTGVLEEGAPTPQQDRNEEANSIETTEENTAQEEPTIVEATGAGLLPIASGSDLLGSLLWGTTDLLAQQQYIVHAASQSLMGALLAIANRAYTFVASLLASITSTQDFFYTEPRQWQMLSLPLPGEKTTPEQNQKSATLKLEATSNVFDANEKPAFVLLDMQFTESDGAILDKEGNLKEAVALGEIARAVVDTQDIQREVVKELIEKQKGDFAQGILNDSVHFSAVRAAVEGEDVRRPRMDRLSQAVEEAMGQNDVQEQMARQLIDNDPLRELLESAITQDVEQKVIEKALRGAKGGDTGGNPAIDTVTNQQDRRMLDLLADEVADAMRQEESVKTTVVTAVRSQQDSLHTAGQPTATAQPVISVKLKGKNGKVTTPKFHFEQGSVILVLEPERTFTPGLYTVEVTVTDPLSGEVQTFEQDFAWGVLAINSNQDRYEPGDIGELDFGVLDDNGEIVCDAQVHLTATSPSGEMILLSTTDNSITVTGTCGQKTAGLIEPDYKTFMTFAEAGIYRLHLEATHANGMRSMDTKITVEAAPQLIIKRIGATRLWPFAPSTMEIEVEFTAPFTGTVTEIIPEGFAVTKNGGATLSPGEDIYGAGTLLKWDGSWSAGQTATFMYEYDAPDISPEFYLLGPATLTPANCTLTSESCQLREARAWQIANDEGEVTISDCTELQSMSANLAGNYIVTQDINCSATSGWNGGEGFIPVGDLTNKFTGTLDGSGYTVSGLYIDRPSTDYVGLFGVISSTSTVDNIHLITVDITGYDLVAGLIGQNFGGTINNAYVSGNVSGHNYIGGLTGHNRGDITRSYVGGITASGASNVGGIAGSNHEFGSIMNVYATGTVIGTESIVGGGVGYNDGIFSNAYTITTVSGIENVGGLVGTVSDDNLIENVYATGEVYGTSGIGGLVGYNNMVGPTLINLYWYDNGADSVTDCIAAGTIVPCTEVSGVDEFYETSLDVYDSNAPTWDFTDVWQSCPDNYPVLIGNACGADATAPSVDTFNPVDNATGIATSSILVLTFNETIGLTGTGYVTIRKTSDNSIVEQINTATGTVTGSGTDTITINPVSDLEEETEYYVLIDSMAFPDEAGNFYAGISDTTTWSFTTADESEPTVSIFEPEDDATDIATNSDLIITFVEAIGLTGTGYVTIRKTSDNSIMEQINTATGTVTGSGTDTITINPVSDLEEGTAYYVLIDSMAFPDTSGNQYAGISDSTTWSFTIRTKRAGSGTIIGYVWNDENGDGTKDAGETTGFNAHTISLSGNTSTGVNVALTDTTDITGAYSFTDVTISDTTGYTLTETTGTPDGYIKTTELTSGGNMLSTGATITVNFGFVLPSTLSGSVFLDANEDGSKGETETSVFSGAILALEGTTATGGTISTTTQTNAAGIYIFPSLPPGSYVIAATTPSGYRVTFSNSRSITIASGGGAATGDFGYIAETTNNDDSNDASTGIVGDNTGGHRGAGAREGGDGGNTGEQTIGMRPAGDADADIPEKPAPLGTQYPAEDREHEEAIQATTALQREQQEREMANEQQKRWEQQLVQAKQEQAEQRQTERERRMENAQQIAWSAAIDIPQTIQGLKERALEPLGALGTTTTQAIVRTTHAIAEKLGKTAVTVIRQIANAVSKVDELSYRAYEYASGTTQRGMQYAGGTLKQIANRLRNDRGIQTRHTAAPQLPPLQQYRTTLRQQDGRSLIATLHISVLSSQGEPYVRTPVVLFSTPKIATTDEEGIASFHDVEVGKHELEIHVNEGSVETHSIIIEPPSGITEEEQKNLEVVMPVIQILVEGNLHGSPSGKGTSSVLWILVGLLVTGNAWLLCRKTAERRKKASHKA